MCVCMCHISLLHIETGSADTDFHFCDTLFYNRNWHEGQNIQLIQTRELSTYKTRLHDGGSTTKAHY